MKKILVFIIGFSLLLSACQKKAANQNITEAKRYPFKGKVVSVDKTARKAKIDNEEIPGYMDAMTMDFPIREDWVWNELTPGSEVRAELVVDNSKNEFWLEKIGIIASSGPNQTAPPPDERFVQLGKDMPNFSLINQDGKSISIKDFRGRALAITFIYRECPLPNYCIKMSKSFSDVANQINADEEMKNKISLLSISFDPQRDTPAKLKQYGLGYLGADAKDLGVWQLAVGSDKEVRKIADFFNLKYEVDQNDKTKINHSLRTAVITPEGKVKKLFPGNDWMPADLQRELIAALR